MGDDRAWDGLKGDYDFYDIDQVGGHQVLVFDVSSLIFFGLDTGTRQLRRPSQPVYYKRNIRYSSQQSSGTFAYE